MENCDVFADVDFGRGTVEVRCTITGPHSRHMCVVEMNDNAAPPLEPVRHAHNVFTTDTPLGMHDRD